MAPSIFESNICKLRSYLGLGKEYDRRAICRYLEIDEDTCLREIFAREGLEYIEHPELGTGSQPAQTFSLVDVFNRRTISFDSGQKVMRQVLLCFSRDFSVLRNYIRNKYAVFYDDSIFIVSRTPEVDNIVVDFNNPYDFPNIKQRLKFRGYSDVDYKTSLNELCRRFGIPIKTGKKQRLCEKLGIEYVQSNFNNFGGAVACSFRNHSTGEILRFQSYCEAAQFFDLHTFHVILYVKNKTPFLQHYKVLDE